MRRITFSKYGIHFETNAGAINAHWNDLVGMGIHKTIKWHFFVSLKRGWGQVIIGIIFLVRKQF